MFTAQHIHEQRVVREWKFPMDAQLAEIASAMGIMGDGDSLIINKGVPAGSYADLPEDTGVQD